MIDRLRAQLDKAWFSARVLFQTGVLGQAERAKHLPRLAAAALRSARGPNLVLLFHGITQPSKEAIVEYGARGTRRLTWGQLHALINRVCHALLDRGVTPGAKVALMLPNGVEFLVAQAALARLGATAVQIGYRSKAPEISHILDNAEPQACIFHARFLAAMQEARGHGDPRGHGGPALVVDGELLCAEAMTGTLTDWERALAAASAELPVLARGKSASDSDDSGGVIIYTSGTTGKPKGANRSWKQTGFDSVSDLIAQTRMRNDERHLVLCPLYHSAAPAFVAMVLALGGTVVLMNHFEPEGALAIIEKEAITSTLVVPTMLVRLCALPAVTRKAYNTSSLRWIMSGAAPLATETARQAQELFGPILWNFYGSTETGLVTLAGPKDHLSRPGTIGRALRGNEIRLLGDDRQRVAVGGVGELYARNSTMISGYHRNRTATDEASLEGLFSVGDLARVDADGYYYLESRKHDMVISGGVNIYPREIEDHLHTHPAILEAAVIGVPDAEWGESLKAFLVVREGMAVTAEEIAAHCRGALADFKRPRQVAFVAELPRNPTGKVLKRALRETP
ncbi:MAG TPA: AMP-binding protein [Kofleriaceae bacterium]|nr:AMP-binding protein [Kofleriaceae bacterium]